jgi:hypothetical protein
MTIKHTIKKLLGLHKYWYLIGLLVVDGFFFGLTNPNSVSSQFLVIGYLFIILSIYALLRAFSQFIGIYSAAAQQTARRMARLLSILAAILLGMQSVGQLSPKDVMALIPLVAVAYIYLAYARRQAV